VARGLGAVALERLERGLKRLLGERLLRLLRARTLQPRRPALGLHDDVVGRRLAERRRDAGGGVAVDRQRLGVLGAPRAGLGVRRVGGGERVEFGQPRAGDRDRRVGAQADRREPGAERGARGAGRGGDPRAGRRGTGRGA